MSATSFIWRPEEQAWTHDSHVARFMRTRGVSTLAELRQASVHCHQWFWDEVLRDMGLEWTRRYTQLRDMSRGFPWTRWFAGGEINVTHNCVERHVRDGHGEEVALLYDSEGKPGESRRVTFAELSDLVDRCALALRAAGVQRGDCVGHLGEMRLPTVVALLAAWKLGARFTPLGPRDGAAAWRAQLACCHPKILLWSGTEGDAGPAAVFAALIAPAPAPRIIATDTDEWEEFLDSGGCMVPQADPLGTGRWKPALPGENTHAEEPCLLLPVAQDRGVKMAVHTHAGCLAHAGKDLRYAFDVRSGEPFFWAPDGDMLTAIWALVGCLIYRAPFVLIDASMETVRSERIARTCARLGVVTLGCSPAIVRGWRRAVEEGSEPPPVLPRLRVLAIGGETEDEATFRWYFDHVGGARCPVVNVGVRAEFFGCPLQSYPIEAVKTCALGGPALGLDLDVFSEEGKSAGRGTTGNLVCKQPAPAMTKSFVGDDERYLEIYFKRFAGAWNCGDRAKVDEDGQWFRVTAEDAAER